MSRFLPKLFINNYKNTEDPKVRNDYGKLAGFVGICTNLLLSIVKIAAGIISASIALIADGLNNLSDASSSLITLIGFKVSAKPPDKDHPFGHQRVEHITGLIVSFFIIYVGTTLLKSGIDKIITPQVVTPNVLIFLFLVFSIILKIWQYFFYKQNGKLINSQTLITTSVDSLNDVITTSVVLISLLITYFFDINIDGYMTVILSIYIIINGIKLVKTTVSPLIGEAPSVELINNVTEDILSYKGVLGIHDLVVHTYGPQKTFITVHVEVDSSVDIIKSHDTIDNIERYINEKYNSNLVIHMDPIETKDEYTIKIKEIIANILIKIDPSLKYHDLRVVRGTTHDNIIFDLEYPVDYKTSENELKKIIIDRVKQYNPRFNLIVSIDTIFHDEDK